MKVYLCGSEKFSDKTRNIEKFDEYEYYTLKSLPRPSEELIDMWETAILKRESAMISFVDYVIFDGQAKDKPGLLVCIGIAIAVGVPFTVLGNEELNSLIKEIKPVINTNTKIFEILARIRDIFVFI
jgi:hypothetical protein